MFMERTENVFVLGASTAVADLSQTALCKALHYINCLIFYNYICVYYLGTEHFWANIISHWTTTQVVRRLMTVPLFRSSWWINSSGKREANVWVIWSAQ